MRPRCRYNPCNFSDDSVVSVARHKLDCLHMDIPQTLEEKLARVERTRKRNANRNARVFFGEQESKKLVVFLGFTESGFTWYRSKVAPPQPILPLNTASRPFRQAARLFRAI
ncbi:hypothetical protein Tco_0892870 [Tanacetum coccineum]|uniref:Uncharacterized protein n=1 Tax=Tanacetum coccineum TaxID=301880 RepID=A0ABQ5CA98_9ASTR